MGALPTGVPAGISTDPESQKEYSDAIDATLKALEARSGNGMNLFSIAGGMLAPTRSGSFGESLGNAATVAGKEMQREEEQAVPIAQMRAQLVGQKYQLKQDAKAQEMIAGALGGMSLQDVAQSISTPQSAIANPAIMQRLASIQAAIPPGSKYADQVKNLIDTQTKMLDLGIKTGQLTNDQIKTFYETGQGGPTSQPSQSVKSSQVVGISSNPLLQIFAGGESGIRNVPNEAGASSAFGPYQITEGTFNSVKKDIPSLKDATFDDFKKDVGGIQTPVAEALLAKNQDLLRSAKVPLSPLNQYSVWFSGDTKLASANPKTPISEILSKEAISANKLEGKTAGDLMNQLQNNLVRGLSSAPTEQPSAGQNVTNGAQTPKGREQVAIDRAQSEQKIRQQATEKENEPWIDKTKEVLKYDNYATKQNLARTDQIQKLVSRNDDIVGILQNADEESLKSWLQAIGTAAQEGVKVGNMGSISIPVEKFFATATLTKNQKLALGELTRHLANEFFAGMKSNRGLLGVNPTDNDARLYQSTMAGTGNLAENIYSWAQTKAAEYETMNQMYKGYVDHRKQFGTTDPASFYTAETSPYHSAVDWYGKKIDTIYGQAPGISGVR